MTAQDYAILGGMFVVVNGLIKVIEIYAANSIKKNGNGKSSSVPNNPIDFHELASNVTEMKSKMSSMSDVLTKTDSDGVPLIYTPRTVIKMLEQQEKLQTRTLDRLDTVLKLLPPPGKS